MLNSSTKLVSVFIRSLKQKMLTISEKEMIAVRSLCNVLLVV